MIKRKKKRAVQVWRNHRNFNEKISRRCTCVGNFPSWDIQMHARSSYNCYRIYRLENGRVQNILVHPIGNYNIDIYDRDDPTQNQEKRYRDAKKYKSATWPLLQYLIIVCFVHFNKKNTHTHKHKTDCSWRRWFTAARSWQCHVVHPAANILGIRSR